MNQSRYPKKTQTSIDSLHEALYNRGKTTKRIEKRYIPSSYDRDVDNEWEDDDDTLPPESSLDQEVKKQPFMRYIFMIVFIGFIASAGYLWWSLSQSNALFSADNIEFSLTGPSFVDGGEEIELTVDILNKNRVPLEFADIVFTYDRSHDGSSQEVIRHPVGTIVPGDSFQDRYTFKFFGEEGEEKQIKAVLEFRIPDSTSLLTANTETYIGIRSSPVRTAFELPQKVFAQQRATGIVTITSNSFTPLNNIIVRLETPESFAVQEMRPQTSRAGDVVWVIPVLEPNQSLSFEVDGIIQGNPQEEVLVKTFVGTQKKDDEFMIETILGSVSRLVRIDTSFMNVAVQANNGTGPKKHILSRDGQEETFTLEYRNTEQALRDVEIGITFDGGMFDENAVTASNALYDKEKKRIFWTKDQEKDFTQLGKGDSGTIRFNLVPLRTGRDGFEQNITMDIDIRGIKESGEMVSMSKVARNEFVFSSAPQIIQRTLALSGPFPSSGVFPPQVGQPTNYTIHWKIPRPSHDLKNVRVVTTLPATVSFVDEVSPSHEKEHFRFINASRTVVWDVGDVKQSDGTNAPIEVYFQVQVRPISSMAGSKIPLTGEVEITALDTHTQEPYSIRSDRHLSTLQGDIRQDPGVVQ